MARQEKLVKITKDGETIELSQRNAYDHVNHLGWKVVGPEKGDEAYTPPEATAPRKTQTIEKQLKSQLARRAKEGKKVAASRNAGPLVMPKEPNPEDTIAGMDALQDLEPDDPGCED